MNPKSQHYLQALISEMKEEKNATNTNLIQLSWNKIPDILKMK